MDNADSEKLQKTVTKSKVQQRWRRDLHEVTRTCEQESRRSTASNLSQMSCWNRAFAMQGLFFVCLDGFNAATRVDYIGELREFGEVVLAHVPVGPKNALDWQKGIWVGKDGSNDTHIVLLWDKGGMATTRSVRNLVEPGCWDMAVFRSRGPPRSWDTLTAFAAENVHEEGARTIREQGSTAEIGGRKLNAAGRSLTAFHAACGKTEGCGGCWHTLQCQTKRKNGSAKSRRMSPLDSANPLTTLQEVVRKLHLKQRQKKFLSRRSWEERPGSSSSASATPCALEPSTAMRGKTKLAEETGEGPPEKRAKTRVQAKRPLTDEEAREEEETLKKIQELAANIVALNSEERMMRR